MKDENGQELEYPATHDFSLDSLQYHTFLYFWQEADPNTGLIPDRSPTESFSSIAATGFGLTAYLVGVDNAYIDREKAADRIHKTLKFLWEAPQDERESQVAGYKGFFYHFLDMQTGYRFEQVELSTIDTGLLMAGILTCRDYFDQDQPIDQQIRAYADSLYRRVEWNWPMQSNGLMSMGWHPESGFIESYWSGYNEAMILLILALGSPTHPISKDSWNHWTDNYLWEDFYGYEQVNFPPLFGHQYSQMYIDFREIQDEYMRQKGLDYFINSRRATLSQQAYCIDNPGNFKGYGENIWGLTACDGPANRGVGDTIMYHTYWARGAAANYINDDGTIAPTAAGGSIPFAPEACVKALEYMYDQFGSRLYGKYGFKDAFNLSYPVKGGNGWFNQDYLGIDQGPIIIQIQNYRNEMIWDLTKRNEYIIKGLKQAGFSGGWLEKLANTY
ncbi:MAG: glucoamylase family protein [Candidatus Cyclobacteriaceae bacterium M3_2C_046]